jgi:hypothetical protein
MSTPTTANVPVAPRVGEQGTSTPGGHYLAYKATSRFPLDAKLELRTNSNPWRPHSPGASFWASVLSKAPATVGAAITLGASAGFKAREVQNHLRWIYTWSYLAVNGQVYAAPPKAPVKAPKAKVPAKA